MWNLLSLVQVILKTIVSPSITALVYERLILLKAIDTQQRQIL